MRCLQWRYFRYSSAESFIIGHIENSDKDCDGVCFGSHTEGCSIVMEVSQSVFNFSMGVTNGDFTDSMIVMFNNTSDISIHSSFLGSYEAVFDSQVPTLLNNGVFPSVTISYFLLNQTQHISIDLSRYVIPPHSVFYASITASSEELVSRIIQLQHRKQQLLKVRFFPWIHSSSCLHHGITILTRDVPSIWCLISTSMVVN